MSLSAAKSRVGFARENLESGRTDGIESMLDAAEGFLNALEEDEAAPVRAEIAAIRAQLAGQISPEDELAVRGARYKIKQVVGWIEMNLSADEIDAGLAAAEEMVGSVPDAHKAEVLAELAALRATRPGKAAPVAEATPPQPVQQPTLAEESLLRRARSSLMWAREPRGELSNVDEADRLLQGVRGELTADLLAEIAALRAEFAARDNAVPQPAAPTPVAQPAAQQQPAAPQQPAPAVPEKNEPTEDELALLRRARTSLLWARENHDGSKIDEAEGYLAAVRAEHKTELVAEIGAIRATIEEAATAERIRQATSFVDARFADAERGSASSIAYCFGRLGSDELVAALPPELMRRYQDRLAAAIDSRVAGLRATAVERAEPLLREIEEHLVPDLFVGLDEGETFSVVGQCENLTSRVEHELWAATNLDTYAVWAEERDPVSEEDKRALNARLVVPSDDHVLSGVRARLDHADRAIADALAAWRTVQLEAEVATRWSVVRDEFDGWRDEAGLELTYLAIVRTRSLLADSRTVEIRTAHPGVPAIEATYQDVERELGAALAKADAAVNQAIDEASRVALPLGEGGLAKLADTQRVEAGRLTAEAERHLADSAYLAPVLTRIRRLDERWQADIAAAIQERQALHDRLATAADAAWPGIVAASGARADFDPATTPPGTVVVLSQVYNRSGWEFNGCDFALRWDTTPVGGAYSDEVRKALEHAWYELKLDVNDRIRWDVIAVVEGRGSIGERTNRVLRDTRTNQEIGKVEEWPPVDCVWLHVTGLHAGPVAVGP